MIIEFADPGYDWTAFIVTGAIAAVLFLIAGVFWGIHTSRQKRGNADFPAQMFLFFGVMWAILGVGLGGTLFGHGAYQDRKWVAIYDAMEDQGLKGIGFSQEKGRTGEFTAFYEGEKVEGTIVNLNYPRDYGYEVVGVEVSK